MRGKSGIIENLAAPRTLLWAQHHSNGTLCVEFSEGYIGSKRNNLLRIWDAAGALCMQVLTFYYKDGKLRRENIETYRDGNTYLQRNKWDTSGDLYFTMYACNGLLHHEEFPALYINKSDKSETSYYNSGYLSRSGGPARITAFHDKDKITEEYYFNGRPVKDYPTKFWKNERALITKVMFIGVIGEIWINKNGYSFHAAIVVPHRLEYPAIESIDQDTCESTFEWFNMGKRHNMTGPACVHNTLNSITCAFYIDGVEFDLNGWRDATKPPEIIALLHSILPYPIIEEVVPEYCFA